MGDTSVLASRYPLVRVENDCSWMQADGPACILESRDNIHPTTLLYQLYEVRIGTESPTRDSTDHSAVVRGGQSQEIYKVVEP